MTTETKVDGAVAVAPNLSQASVEALSFARHEPDWMLELRLRAWRFFQEIPWPTGTEETWRRTKLTGFKLEDFQPLVGAGAVALPEDVRAVLAEVESAGEIAFVDGGRAHYRLDPAVAAQGVIFTDLASAAHDHPELVQRAFASVVSEDENKFSALHYALWNSGTFVYVPRNVHQPERRKEVRLSSHACRD